MTVDGDQRRPAFRAAAKEHGLEPALPLIGQDQFDASGLTDTIGRERFYPTVEAAVRATRVDAEVAPS